MHPEMDLRIIGRSKRFLLLFSLLLLSLILAYLPSFQASFIFDDQVNIIENPTLRSLWPLWNALRPPTESGLVGRPLVNLSLALNYAVSGTSPWSYHLLNLAIHLGATVLLWGLLHELLAIQEEQSWSPLFLRKYLPWTCALLWGLHPLQTQSVTYIIQRCESLMGFFFMATVYAYVRSWQSIRPLLWQTAALMAFLACLACKEVAVTLLPLMWVIAWTFKGENPVRATRNTPVLLAGILASLMLLALATWVGRGYSTHPDHLLPSGLRYTMAQGQILLRYLRLSFWPSDLTLDYGWPIGRPEDTWRGAAVMLSLVATTCWLVFRRYRAGLLGAWFFFVLAPTSLVPLPDPIFEHRMYLPLAAVVVLTVFGLLSLSTKLGEGRSWGRFLPKTILVCFTLLSLPLGWRTYQRNKDYRSSLSIWADTMKKRPMNFRAYHGVAGALAEQGDLAGSLPFLRRAAALNPLSFSVRNDLGITLIKLQRFDEAIAELRQALRYMPTSAITHNNLGGALLMTGKVEEAIPEFQAALHLKPGYESPRRNLELAQSMLKASRTPPR